MAKNPTVELLTEDEIQDIVTPSSKEIRTNMPHRISSILTKEDREYLQRHRNKQDIVHSLVTQFLVLIRKQPEYVKKQHLQSALNIAINSRVLEREKAEEDNTTIKEKE